jgi:serine/threonine protein kinase
MRDAVRTGSVVAGYRFDSLIGEGAMGAVCLAEDATHELRVAVKAYKPPAAFRSDGFGMATWTSRARWTQLAARPSSPSSTGTQPAADADVTAIGAVDDSEGARSSVRWSEAPASAVF